MSVEAQQAVRQFESVEIPLIRALTRQNKTHGVLALYLRLLLDADEKAPPRTVAELGEMVGVSSRTAARVLRVLRKLGVVRDAGEFLIVVTHTADRRIIKALEGISEDRGVIDVVEGIIKAVDSDKVFDYPLMLTTDTHGRGTTDTHGSGGGTTDTYGSGLEGLTPTPATHVLGTEDEVWQGKPRRVRTYPISIDQQSADHPSLTVKNPHIYKSRSTVVLNTSRSTSTRRNTNHLITIENSTPNTELETSTPNPELEIAPKAKWAVEEIPVTADKLPHNKLFDPFRDPFQADIESVVGYANEKLGTRYSLYSATGAPNDRYRVVFRCFYHFGLSAVDLKKAVDNIPRHDYWGPRKVRDLLKLFREQSNCEGLVNYVAPDADPRDRRALDCAPVAAGRIVISEEF